MAGDTGRTRSNATASRWKSSLYVWLKSEFLHNSNSARFGFERTVFEQPCWPLGLRVRGDGTGDIIGDAAYGILDNGFDHDVGCAWQLPLWYSRLKLAEKAGFGARGSLNWLIRSVGHW